ncbi:MAG: tetratricopeptide repeat protein [Xanthomonadales bacterium]|nr:tetratricopeptide repeat protein [Xanthomonadales bacterium]
MQSTPSRLRRLSGCLFALLLAGCAASPGRDAADEAAQAGSAPAPAPVEAPLEPTDEEVMYRVFAAEYLGAEGDLQSAVGEYLEAALLSDDPEIAQRATRVAFAAEAWQQAVMAADRWALLDPDDVGAHESAAAAMLTVGDYFGAEFHIMRILDLMNDSTQGWLLVSNLLAQSADPARADASLEQILAQRENAAEGDVFYARSQLAVQARELRQAFELARRAVESDPDRIEFLTWAGRLALNLKLPETGLEYIRRAWELDPEDHDLALAYADLLARTGDADGARAVMSDMKQTPDVLLSRILFELAAGERQAAETLFDAFAALPEEYAEERIYYQAQAAEALGLIDRAIALYGQVDTGDSALDAALRRAELLARQGEMEQARSELEALREQPNELAVEESWLAEARILREAGDRDEAFHVLDEAVEQQPRSIPILYTRALLAAELGWVDIAERDLRAVLVEQPENAAALNALGYTLADQTERYEEAEVLIRQAYILQPHEPSIIDSMGWVAFKRGRYAEAEEFLRRAWRLDRNAEIGAHLGEVLWVTGQRDEAVKAWREAQDVDSKNPVLMETLERLDVVF